jgi:hypothetical protein
MKTILAIDPGASGGIAEWCENKIYAFAMPDDAELVQYLIALDERHQIEGGEIHAYVELVGGFIAGNPAPGSAMFNFGRGYGYILGALAALKIPTNLIRPQVWQAGIPGVRGIKEKAQRKRALKEHAYRLFPTAKITLATADALCIAEYARTKEIAP